MRLQILETGHGETQRELLQKSAEGLGLDVAPDVERVLLYRPRFLGKPYCDYLHPAMRGESPWSAGERELMAAFVSQQNQCPW